MGRGQGAWARNPLDRKSVWNRRKARFLERSPPHEARLWHSIKPSVGHVAEAIFGGLGQMAALPLPRGRNLL